MSTGAHAVLLKVNQFGQGTLFVDGQELTTVARLVEIRSRVGELTRVIVELVNVTVEADIKGLVDVTAMDDGYRRFVPLEKVPRGA
jgi:hypothetical protein